MIINVTDHCNIQGYQYDQVSLVVGVVEEGSSKDGRKGSKDEVRKISSEEERPERKHFHFS